MFYDENAGWHNCIMRKAIGIILMVIKGITLLFQFKLYLHSCKKCKKEENYTDYTSGSLPVGRLTICLGSPTTF